MSQKKKGSFHVVAILLVGTQHEELAEFDRNQIETDEPTAQMPARNCGRYATRWHTLIVGSYPTTSRKW